MAIIPKAQTQVRNEVRGLPQQSSRASASAFGALTGQAMEQVGGEIRQLGDQVAKVVIETNEENIRRYSRDLDNEYAAFHEQVLLGDGSAENQGYLSLNGENAVQGLPNVTKLLADKRAELAARAGNQKVTDYFNQAADVRDEQTGSALFRHVNTQREVANDASADARVSRAKSDAALNFNDTGIIDRSAMILSEEIFSKAKRKGWSDEAAQEAFRIENADMVEKMVTSALQTDIKQAEKLYQTYGQDVDGVTKAAIFQKLDAKRRQIVADMESQETGSHQERIRWQKDNKDTLTKMFATGTLTETTLTEYMVSGKVDSEQYQDMLGLLRNPPGDEGSNIEEVNRLKVGIHQGQVTVKDIDKNTLLTPKQKGPLYDLFFTEEDKGAMLNRADVKSARDWIDAKIGGVRGPMAILEPEISGKVADALNFFNQRVMNALPNEITPTNIEAWKAESIATFKPGGLGSPEANIRAVPKPSVWPSDTVFAPKKFMDMMYTQAIETLESRMALGTMSQTDAINDLRLLKHYKNQIDQLEE